jgi:hypothetical protein
MTPEELTPAAVIVHQALHAQLSDTTPNAEDLRDTSEVVVARLLHAGWLQIPTSAAVPLLAEASPDMDSGGAG